MIQFLPCQLIVEYISLILPLDIEFDQQVAWKDTSKNTFNKSFVVQSDNAQFDTEGAVITLSAQNSNEAIENVEDYDV